MKEVIKEQMPNPPSMTIRQWSLEEVRGIAETKGKLFDPPDKLMPRMVQKLQTWALVLFEESDVQQAIDAGLIHPSYKDPLLAVIVGVNNVMVIAEKELGGFQREF